MISLTKRLRNFRHHEEYNKAELEKLCKEAADKIDDLDKLSKRQLIEIGRLKQQTLKHRRDNVNMKNKNTTISNQLKFISRTQ